MTTTSRQLIVPTPEQIENTAKRVEFLWELVPRSAKPLHQQVKNDVDKVLRLVHRFLATRSTQLQTAVAMAANAQDTTTRGSNDGVVEDDARAAEEAPPLPMIMRMLRLMDPEQILQVRILLMLNDERMTDEGRLEIFDELELSHHLDCGVQVYADEDHECPLGGEEDDEEKDDEDTSRAADDDGSSRTPPAVLPVVSLPSPSSEEPR